MMTIENLPDNVLLGNVFPYLSTTERSRLLGVNRRWFFGLKDDCETSIQTLVVDQEDDGILLRGPSLGEVPECWPRRMLETNFSSNLHTLELNKFCTDGFLRLMAEEKLFPGLRHISMRGSFGVTDRGLEWLSQHPGDCIETIDLTFCSHTTYGGTFCLREKFHSSLKLLRRQPSWLDGQFHTPFRNSSSNSHSNITPEIHTYYPDGTFAFTRSTQSRGFVAELYEWDVGCVEDDRLPCVADKLQYTNFAPYAGWPVWTTYSYRPGVCLFPLPDVEGEDGTTIRSVLVGQGLRALRPPPATRDIVNRHYQDGTASALSSMAVGTSTYFAKLADGSYIRSDDMPTDTSGGVMISRMRVYPLESVIPPEDLVAECRRTCHAMKQLGERMLGRFEAQLQYMLDS